MNTFAAINTLAPMNTFARLKLIFTRISILCSLGLSILLSTHTQLALAQKAKTFDSSSKQVIYFDLPGQSLKSSLIEFAVQSKLNILVDSELVEGFNSRPIIGPHAPEKALAILISKAPLKFTVYEEKSIILIESATIQSDAENEQKTVSNTEAYLEEVIVRSNRYPFKYNTISNTQLYGNLTFYNSARFLSTIPATLINDQTPTDLAESLRLSSSFTPGDGLADSNDDYFVRGFPRYGIYIDGFRLSSNTGIKRLPENIERVEILKGPSTIFYGQAEPGGIVNVVRKKPQVNRQSTLRLRTGSGKLQSASLDLTGSAPHTNKKLQYRLIGLDERRDTYGAIKDIERSLLSASLSWDASDTTQIDLNLEHLENNQYNSPGTIIIAPFGDSITLVTLNQSPRLAQSFFNSEQDIVDLHLYKYLTNNWTLKTKFFAQKETMLGVRASQNTLLNNDFLINASDFDPDLHFVRLDGIIIPIADGTTINSDLPQDTVIPLFSLYDEHNNEESGYAQLILDGSFETLNLAHDLSFGIDAHYQATNQTYTIEKRGDLTQLDIDTSGDKQLEEIFSGVFTSNDNLGELINRRQFLRFRDYGAFFLDTLTLDERWHATLGGRLTETQGYFRKNETAPYQALEVFHNFSAELGLRYEPVDDFAIYANYSEGFKANYQVDEQGTQLYEPEESHQIELGSKLIALGGKLISTASMYAINKKNVVDIEFDQSYRVAYSDGEQDHYGFDMDLSYQITSNTNLIASLALLKAKKQDASNRELTPKMTADVVGSLFINHEFSKGLISGLNLSASLYHVGDRFADKENTVVLDRYSIANLNLSYPIKVGPVNYELKLAAKNVLDKEYLATTEENIRRTQGIGRSFVLSFEASY